MSEDIIKKINSEKKKRGIRDKYTMAQRTAILKDLERNDFSYKAISKKTGVCVSTIKSWVKKYGDEIFSFKSKGEVVQEIINKSSKVDVAIIDNEKKRQEICAKSLSILGARLDNAIENDMLNQSKFSNKDLIQIVKLVVSPEGESITGQKKFNAWACFINQLNINKNG